MITAKRYFYLLTAVFIILLALIVAGAVGSNMVLQKQAKRLSDLKVENQTIELQQNALIQAKKDVEKYSELEKIAKSVVPQDKDQAKTVREIVKIAQDNRVPIQSVSFQTSTLGDTATPGSSAAGTKTPQTAVSQVKPVQGIPGVYTLEIQVSSAGTVSYQNFLKFLESLEKNRRTAHVNGISLKPNENGTQLEFNLTLNAYVKP